MRLEATPKRKKIWRRCCEGECAGCPYKYSCEEDFPYTRDDCLPCDYHLTPDGKAFVPAQ